MKIPPFRASIFLITLSAVAGSILALEPRCFAASPAGSQFKSLYDAHQWLQLRDALQATTNAPLFYRAAVAWAFNDSEACEEELLQFLKSAPPSAEACEAHNVLESLYWRTGRFRLALSHLEQAVALGDKEGDSATLRALSRLPEMSVAQRRVSTIHVWYKNAHVPVRINGKSYKCYLDTGANISVISESAAKRLGLALSEVSGAKVTDSTGSGLALKQVAVAERLTIGNIQLEHVPFIVLSDRAQPFVGWSSGKRCILGLQVLLACQTVRWKSAFMGAALELGVPPGPRNIRNSNLFFDGTMPHVAAGFGQHTLDLFLDTGAGRSRLEPRFAEQFPELVRGSGKKGVSWHQGMSGAVMKVETMTIPELRLRLGGFDTTFRRIEVHLKGAGSPREHGMLGQDLLKKAREVTFDFDAMTLTLR